MTRQNLPRIEEDLSVHDATERVRAATEPSATLRLVRATRAPYAASVGGLFTIAFVIPLLIARHYGALGIPRSDDWSYLVSLFRWVDSGRLSFNHWVSMTLVGQLAIAAPLAAIRTRPIAGIQELTAALGLVGLVCVAAIPARVTKGRWVALFIAVTIAAGPLWGPLAVSYMTDVPTFALSALALLLGLVAFDRHPISMPLLMTSALVGLAAFTIRQYSVVLIAAVLLTGAWSFASDGDRRRVAQLAFLGLVLTLLMAGFLIWWNTIPDGRSLAPSIPTVHSVGVSIFKGAGFLRLVGLLLLPLIVATGPVMIVRRSWRASHPLTVAVATGTLAWLAASAWRVPGDLFVGNYVMRDGVLSDIVLIGRRPDVFPPLVWATIVMVASAASILLALSVVPLMTSLTRRVRVRDLALRDPVETYLILVTLGYCGAYFLATASGLQVYDRYILPALPAIGLLLLRSRNRTLKTADSIDGQAPRARTGERSGSRIATAVALVGLAAIGLSFTADSASFDGARWRVATLAVRRGWSRRTINGGFEWLNYHRGDLRRDAGRNPPLCVTVHINPERRPKHVVAIVQSSAPTRATVPLVAFRTTNPCPRPGPNQP